MENKMSRTRLIASAFVAASALVASSVAVAADSSPARVARQVRTGGEYVVAFRGPVADAR